MPILNWIGKEAVVNHDKEVPFRLLKKVKSLSYGDNSQNLIIHGDNLEALKALMPYYQGQVKCIYIDPPYNTGNENWVYNDRVNSPKIKKWLGKVVGSESEDLCRHDKWLCMMYPRLKLLKDLLSDNGVIFVSIDDNEYSNLKSLLDEIFGENNIIGTIVWKKKYTGGQHSRFFVDLHEYILVYSKNKPLVGELLVDRPENEKAKFQLEDEFIKDRGRFYIRPLKSNLELRPTLIYPIKCPDKSELKTQWLVSEPTFIRLKKEGRILFKKKRDGNYQVYMKYYERDRGGKVKVPSIIDFTSNNDAKVELKELFGIEEGRDNVFYTVKPTKLINFLINFSTNNEDIILDSFAGSGTTGHAVMQLNKLVGNRKFIMIQLDEQLREPIKLKDGTVLKEVMDITRERIKRAIKKYEYQEGFEYCELDKPLFNENGQIEQECTFEQLATYIYFTETNTNIDRKGISGNLIGNYDETEYYLIFKEKGKNILSKEFIKKLQKDNKKKVIYADKCFIDERTLEKHRIQFKQIPYEIKVY
jgi:adenine specific DNA methylase Mod